MPLAQSDHVIMIMYSLSVCQNVRLETAVLAKYGNVELSNPLIHPHTYCSNHWIWNHTNSLTHNVSFSETNVCKPNHISTDVNIWQVRLTPSFLQRCCDGGFTSNIPFSSDPDVISVSPFSGDCDICPQGESASPHIVNISDQPLQISAKNIVRLTNALCPTSWSQLEELFHQGYSDGLRFFRRKGVCVHMWWHDHLLMNMSLLSPDAGSYLLWCPQLCEVMC